MAAAYSDKIGLIELHLPDDPVVDICFVQGLHGGSVSTWTREKHCWPQHQLPIDIPDARIVSFGYEAKFAGFWSSGKVSQNSVEQHAANLMAALVADRSKSKTVAERPLIFVAHSLGGSVCAQAIITARSCIDEPERAMEECTRRAAFLGTPFHGSDLANWAIFNDTNSAILDDLKGDSSPLAQIAEGFPKWLQERSLEPATKVDIVCFTEEKVSSSLGKKVVKDESARITGDHDKVQSLNADHIGMCKASGKDDDKYQAVLGVLRRWVKELKAASEAKKPETGSTANFYSSIQENKGVSAYRVDPGFGVMNFGIWVSKAPSASCVRR